MFEPALRKFLLELLPSDQADVGELSGREGAGLKATGRDQDCRPSRRRPFETHESPFAERELSSAYTHTEWYTVCPLRIPQHKHLPSRHRAPLLEPPDPAT